MKAPFSVCAASRFIFRQQQSVMDQIQKLINPFKFEALDRIPSLKIIEQKLKVKPSVLLILILTLLILLSPFLKTYNLLTSIICYLIPAYLSFIALETTEKEDDIRYLTYWIIFSIVEVSTPLFRLFFNKFIYMIIRISITLVLLHPLSNITSLIYNNFICPLISQNEKAVDSKIDELVQEGKKKVVEGVQQIKNLV